MQKLIFGLNLSGARNAKTHLAVMEYYEKEQKLFLLEVYENLGETEDQNADEALLSLLEELSSSKKEKSILAVDSPLTLPPWIPFEKENGSVVKWMREYQKKHDRRKSITPYTQRPIELWLKYDVFPNLAFKHKIEIDETLGGSKAPLTARMHYLKAHLKKFELIEANPKLSTLLIAKEYHLTQKLLRNYRTLEDGAYSREKILEQIGENENIFIYEKDFKRLTQNLNAFDAFMTAFTGYLKHTNRTEKKPKSFPLESGWVEYPKGD